MNHDQSRLIEALREAVAVVQMVFFKQTKALLTRKYSRQDERYLLGLAGAITNEVFGSVNPEPVVVAFREQNRGAIEQEMLALRDDLGELCGEITDALRIQTLCDHQLGIDSSPVLLRAKEYGYLVEERDIPLPSSFMTLARQLGAQHKLISPPLPTPREEYPSTVH
jgi:hypothetical protein